MVVNDNECTGINIYIFMCIVHIYIYTLPSQVTLHILNAHSSFVEICFEHGMYSWRKSFLEINV